jgi:hypothetical protein
MSNQSEEIRRAILAIVDSRLPIVCSWHKVKSISEDGQFCDVCDQDDEDLLITDVILGYDKSGVRIKPKVDFLVLVLFVTKTNGFVIAAEQTDELELMGINYGGIPILEKVQDNLDEIKSYLADLKTAISAGFNGIGSGSAASGTAGNTAFTNSMIGKSIVFDEMEGKVKHGNGE